MQSKVKLNNYSVIFVVVRIKDETKIDGIYKATLALVKERGLAGITMCDISKAASLGTGTLYIYFKNKEELIKALFLQCRQQSAQQYFEGLDSRASFEKRMEKVFSNIIRFKMNFFEVSAFLEQSYHSPFVCITDLKKKQKALQPLYELMREGIEAKKIKKMDADMVISFMFGIIHEWVKNAYFSKRKLSAPAIRELYSLYWDGVRHRGKAAPGTV